MRRAATTDPVQVGCVWLSGGSSDCRNLLDFIGIALHEGRAYVAYSDGCPEGCTEGPECVASMIPGAAGGRPSVAMVAIVQRGPSLADPAVALAPLP